MHTQTHMHTYIRIHTFIHTYIRKYIHTYKHTYRGDFGCSVDCKHLFHSDLLSQSNTFTANIFKKTARHKTTCTCGKGLKEPKKGLTLPTCSNSLAMSCYALHVHSLLRCKKQLILLAGTLDRTTWGAPSPRQLYTLPCIMSRMKRLDSASTILITYQFSNIMDVWNTFGHSSQAKQSPSP